MIIRNATTKDAPSIAKIQIQTWQAAYQDFMPQDFLASLSSKQSLEEKTQQWIKGLSPNSKGTSLLIEYNKKPVGFCVFGPTRDKDLATKNNGELVALNILPNYWGKGFGTATIKYVIKQSKQQGWQALYLWVIKENSRARAVYKALGFIEEGSEKTDSKLTGHNLNEVRYIKQL